MTFANLMPWPLSDSPELPGAAARAGSGPIRGSGPHAEIVHARTMTGTCLPVLYSMAQVQGKRGSCATGSKVALTIDDGPSWECTPHLLELLARADARASFFLIGRRAEQHPDLVRAILAAGHEVLNHGFNHVILSKDPRLAVRELDRTEKVLSAFRTPSSPYWLRLPYGDGWDNAKLHKAIKNWRSDAVLVQWAVSFEEWTIPGRSTDSLSVRADCRETVARVLQNSPAPGDIVLLHDRMADATSFLAVDTSIALLAELLAGLRDRNFTGCTLSDLARARIAPEEIQPPAWM